MAVRPGGDEIDAVTESDDDVPLGRPGQRPRVAEADAVKSHGGRDPGSSDGRSSWDGYVQPKCGNDKRQSRSTSWSEIRATAHIDAGMVEMVEVLCQHGNGRRADWPRTCCPGHIEATSRRRSEYVSGGTRSSGRPRGSASRR